MSVQREHLKRVVESAHRIRATLQPILEAHGERVHFRPTEGGVTMVGLLAARPQRGGAVADLEALASTFEETFKAQCCDIDQGRETPEKAVQSYLIRTAQKQARKLDALNRPSRLTNAPVELLFVSDEIALFDRRGDKQVCDLLALRVDGGRSTPVSIELKSDRQMTRLVAQVTSYAACIDEDADLVAELYAALLGQRVAFDRPCEKWIVWPRASKGADPRGRARPRPHSRRRLSRRRRRLRLSRWGRCLTELRFPFGRLVTPRPASANAPCPLFILGAYPSALHISWTPPHPWKRVKAIPIDDEPTPFWDGADHSSRVAAWREAISFDEKWGEAGDCDLNGSSGAWVESKVLAAFGVRRTDAWITDCLDTYRASDGAKARIADTYAPFARALKAAEASLLEHPSEKEIVEEALRHHRVRLLAELRSCRPDIVVTLGNAALRVLRGLCDDDGELPAALAPEPYGGVREVRIAERVHRVFALAHPASPPRYQAAHGAWLTVSRRAP